MASLAEGRSQDPSIEGVDASDLDWLVPVAAISTIEIGLWFLEWRLGYAQSPLFGRYGALGEVFLGAAGITAFLIQVAGMAMRGEPRPLASCAAMLQKNAGRIFMVVAAVQCSVLEGAAFSTLKTALPTVVPFWLDPRLARFESGIFSVAPWELSQRLFGWATPGINYLYASWLTVQIIAFYTLLLLKPSPLKTHALVTHALAWLLLGIVGAYAFSSAGPIFYDRIYGGHAFAGLQTTLEHADVAVRTSNMLWRTYFLHTNEVASGISAMPSMHVALALWLALLLAKTRVAAAAWAYYALIFIGSVHLGWHYVSDGVVGSLGMYLIWRAVPQRPSGTSGAKRHLPYRN